MNNKTARLIRNAIDKKFPEEDNRARYQKAKKDWNSTPKNDRWLSRRILKSWLNYTIPTISD